MAVALIQLAVYLVPLIAIYFIGGYLERRHYKSIHERERLFVHIPAVTGKRFAGDQPIADSALCVGSVVVSVDHFKRFLAGFRRIFGGEIKSYATLIDRGRREALLRMKEVCPDADMYLNCRIETSTISNGKGKAIGCVEIMAFCTALHYQK